MIQYSGRVANAALDCVLVSINQPDVLQAEQHK